MEPTITWIYVTSKPIAFQNVKYKKNSCISWTYIQNLPLLLKHHSEGKVKENSFNLSTLKPKTTLYYYYQKTKQNTHTILRFKEVDFFFKFPN